MGIKQYALSKFFIMSIKHFITCIILFKIISSEDTCVIIALYKSYIFKRCISINYSLSTSNVSLSLSSAAVAAGYR